MTKRKRKERSFVTLVFPFSLTNFTRGSVEGKEVGKGKKKEEAPASPSPYNIVSYAVEVERRRGKTSSRPLPAGLDNSSPPLRNKERRKKKGAGAFQTRSVAQRL